MFNQRLNLFKINMVSIDPGKNGAGKWYRDQ